MQVENTGSPWHAGEVALQQKVGSADQLEKLGASIIRPFMPDQHREFFTQLPFLVAGTVDEAGDAWATLLTGKPGFLQSPQDTVLEVTTAVDSADPAAGGIYSGASAAFLGIELHTRRRNRMNGTVQLRQGGTGFSITVGQSFGNCPQYIQLRDYEFVRDPMTVIVTADDDIQIADESSTLTARAVSMIVRADTFFVTSYVDLPDGRQVDVSHRGGKAGFVRVGSDGVLSIPDYSGNRFFNTLGNIIENPRVGLIFPDFETGDVIQLTGDAKLVPDSAEVEAFAGAERIWTVTPRKIIYRKDALPIRWSFAEYSPNSLSTGSWQEAKVLLDVADRRQQWHPLRVTKIERESEVIRSFWLAPEDSDNAVAVYEAGQHLAVRVSVPGSTEPVLRTYTLSVAPSDMQYRISVKREGLVSSYLHDHIAVGDVIEARAPQGSFTIDSDIDRPVVMLAAGVGITPFVSMLRHLVSTGSRTGKYRNAFLFQAARSLQERAFDQELNDLAAASGGAIRIVRLLDSVDSNVGDEQGIKGRITIDLLKSRLPFDDYDFYLCGPPVFMEVLYSGLRKLNVRDSRIFFESFGPASVTRQPDSTVVTDKNSIAAAAPIQVHYKNSDKGGVWEPESGSLLELAEASGLSPSHSCRMGSCGSCATKVVEGEVAYAEPPGVPVGEDEALICCAVPSANMDADSTLVLGL